MTNRNLIETYLRFNDSIVSSCLDLYFSPENSHGQGFGPVSWETILEKMVVLMAKRHEELMMINILNQTIREEFK